MKKNKKKGFTLIELLAVIVILAIIALIATPIILNVIDKAKNGAAESSAYGYIDAVEKQVMLNQVSGTDLITPNVYDKAALENDKKVDAKEKESITNLIVRVDEKGQVVEGKFCINGKSIDYDGKKAKYKKEENYCEGELTLEGAIAKKYTIVTDANSNGTSDVGDEIALGDEHFYVISNNGTNINALAKYNLNVGDYALDSTIGIQNEIAIGYPTSKNVTVPFSSDSQKGTNYSDYNGSVIEGYVNDYVTYLNTNNSGLNAEGSLISKEELENLINDGESLSYGNIKDNIDAKGYSWVYSTSYWFRSINSDTRICSMYTSGIFGHNSYSSDSNFGVRPVITIDS